MDDPGEGHGCRKLLAVAALVFTVAFPATTAAAPSTTAEAGNIVNGPVSHTLRTPTRTYIGGQFDYVGPPTGYAVGLDAAGSIDAAFPEVNGTVLTSVADGSNGWFIGGEFDRVGGLERQGVARILANGAVDPAWNPQVTNTSTRTTVRGMSRSGSKLYIVGSFDAVDGTTRHNAAAITTTTGEFDPAWTPTVTSPRAVLASGTRVYLAGSFTLVNNTARQRLAAVNATTGALDTGFVANLASSEPNAGEALALLGTRLYVSGQFDTVNGSSRPGIAAVDTTTGALDTTFAAGLTGLSKFDSWTTLQIDNNNGIGRLFAGNSRGRLLSVDGATGVRHSAFAPGAFTGTSTSTAITALAANGNNLYVGGTFTRVGDVRRLRYAVLNTASGALSTQNVQSFSDAPRAIAQLGAFGRIFVGGEFTSAGGVERRSLVALDAAGDIDTEFQAPALTDGFDEDADVRALAIGEGSLFIGGNIRDVDGAARTGVIALDPATGALRPGFDAGDAEFGSIDELLLREGRLYVGGQFPRIGGAPRTNLAALDPVTGAALAEFTPDPDREIRELAFSGGRLFVGGAFTTIGGLTRPFLAALDGATGVADPAFEVEFETNQQSAARALAIDGTRLYVGGNFVSVNGFPRTNLAAVSTTTGATVAGWTTTSNGTVEAIAVGGERVFIGGFFNQVNATVRRGVAAISRTSGALDPWDVGLGDSPVPNAGSSLQSLSIAFGRIDVGGFFASVARRGRMYVASFATPMPVNTSAPTVAGTPREGQALTCAPGTWTNAPGFTFAWERDGRTIAGATAPAYALTGADAGRRVACRVTAANADGTAEATSATAAVDPPPAAFVPPPPPTTPAPAPPQGPPTAGAQPPRLAPVTGGASTVLTASLAAIRGNRLARAALARGVTLTTKCSATATATATLTVSAATARKLGIRGRQIGSGRAACDGKPKLKLTAAKVRRAKRAVPATLTVVFTRPGATPVTIRRSVTLT